MKETLHFWQNQPINQKCCSCILRDKIFGLNFGLHENLPHWQKEDCRPAQDKPYRYQHASVSIVSEENAWGFLSSAVVKTNLFFYWTFFYNFSLDKTLLWNVAEASPQCSSYVVLSSSAWILDVIASGPCLIRHCESNLLVPSGTGFSMVHFLYPVLFILTAEYFPGPELLVLPPGLL